MAGVVVTREGRKTREQQAAEQAADLITFADGIEDAGHPELARRSRAVARETVWLVDELESARSLTRAVKERNDAMLGLLGNRVFCEACADAMRKAGE